MTLNEVIIDRLEEALGHVREVSAALPCEDVDRVKLELADQLIERSIRHIAELPESARPSFLQNFNFVLDESIPAKTGVIVPRGKTPPGYIRYECKEHSTTVWASVAPACMICGKPMTAA